MNYDRMGVIAFFGILIPGSYLTGVLILFAASCLEIAGLNGHAYMREVITFNIAISTTAFLFISYLLGVLVRLFAPNYVDALSKYYLRYLRLKKNKWITDCFPYQETLSSIFLKSGMNKVTELFGQLNPKYGQKGNTTFFNYCKWFIEANDPALSKQVQQTEAFVRFLSGTTLVLLIAIPLFLTAMIAFICHNSPLYWIIYAGLFVMAMLCLCLILERFRYQRRREVILIWSSVYLIVNGGTVNGKIANKSNIIDSMFFKEGHLNVPGNLNTPEGTE